MIINSTCTLPHPSRHFCLCAYLQRARKASRGRGSTYVSDKPVVVAMAREGQALQLFEQDWIERESR